jgi:hypothetical protein
MWLPQADAARAVRMSPANFISQLRPKLPPGAVRQQGRSVLIHLPDLIDYVVKRAEERLNPEELLLAGADSPALEKYRAMRAGQEEIKLQRMRGNMVAVDEVKTGLQQIVGAVRRGVERLQRAYGNEAAELVLEPLGDLEHGWEAVLGSAGVPAAPQVEPTPEPPTPSPADAPDLESDTPTTPPAAPPSPPARPNGSGKVKPAKGKPGRRGK